MKLLNFGSLNIDHTYHLPHLVREGETISSTQYQKNEGGKGFNQAVALAKAGQQVYMAGAVGYDGQFLLDYLKEMQVNTDYLQVLDAPTGHALIQVDAAGRNSIILFGGTNQMITPALIDQTLSHFDAGDYVLLQNEISCVDYIIRAAYHKGMHVVLNPSPMTPALLAWPLEMVDIFMLNEIEGGDITGKTEPDDILDEMLRRYPHCRVVLTLGDKGAVYADAATRLHQAAVPTVAVDTTAAGDTFTGYFLHALLHGQCVQQALQVAAQASSIAVSRPGAGRSVPLAAEVAAVLASQ